MRKNNNNFAGRIKSVLVAAAIALVAVPALTTVAEPIEANAYYDSVREKLNEQEQKLFDAYKYLNSHMLAKDTKITAKTLSKFSTSDLFTMYKDSDTKFTYSKDDRVYARRAFIYDDPMDISRAMVDLKFVYIQDKTTKKYTCYAYLVKTTDSDYKAEEKALDKAIDKIMDVVEDSKTSFAEELQIYELLYDNVSYVNKGIGQRNLCNTAYGALVQHRASSQGYALAFAALLDEAGIDNNILFSDKRVWNQVCVTGKANGSGEKWYEVDASYTDWKLPKAGIITYTYFNVPTRVMDRLQRRVNFATNFRESKGSERSTDSNQEKYNNAILEDSQNITLGVLNADGTVTRTTLLSSEKLTAGSTLKLVPVFTYGRKIENFSDRMSAVTVTPVAGSAFTVTTPWTKESGYLVVTLDNPAAAASFNCSFTYQDSTKPITKAVTLAVEDESKSAFTFQIKDNVAYLKSCTNKKLQTAVIPATITKGGKEYKVTKVCRNAFKKCKKLEVVILGANVKEVEDDAFSGKANLIRVETAGFVLNKIGDDAFDSADENTLFLLKADNYKKYEKLVKKIKRSGADESVFKYRRKTVNSGY